MAAQAQTFPREIAWRSRECRLTPRVKSVLTQQRDLRAHAG